MAIRIIPPRRIRGFTLVEIAMVLAIMSLVAGIILVSSNNSGWQLLQESAATLSGDLMLARDAAFTAGTEYTVSFNLQENSYSVLFSGSGQAPPFERPSSNGSTGNFTVSLTNLHPGGNGGRPVTLFRVRTEVSNQDVQSVVFNSQGSTGPARTEDTVIWLAQGTGTDVRYQKITISWLTGQVWTSDVMGAP